MQRGRKAVMLHHTTHTGNRAKRENAVEETERQKLKWRTSCESVQCNVLIM